MRDHLHRRLLQVFQFLPRRLRRRIIGLGTPSFTVGALCVIDRPDGAVLLVASPYRPYWGLPGGLLGRGEQAADAARREVFEEVGLVVELVGEPAVVVEPGARRVDVIYRARPASTVREHLDALAPRSPEIERVGWFPMDALPSLGSEATTALMAVARSSAPGGAMGREERGR